jgi:hypothetical protein
MIIWERREKYHEARDDYSCRFYRYPIGRFISMNQPISEKAFYLGGLFLPLGGWLDALIPVSRGEGGIRKGEFPEMVKAVNLGTGKMLRQAKKRSEQLKSVSAKSGAVLMIGIVILGCAGMRETHWKSLSSTDLYEAFYYVSKSHLLYKATVLVSVKIEYTEKGVAAYVKEFGKDYENLSYSLQLWEVDCRGRTQRMTTSTQYSATGNVIRPSKGRLSESLGKKLSEAVCE